MEYNLPLISVIIPTCNRSGSLAASLNCLKPENQTLSPDNYEVIISDDGCMESSRNSLRFEFPWARWFQGPGRGPAANRNHGARQSQATWLAFTDDDCLPDRGWLSEYKAAALLNSSCVLEGMTVSIGQPDAADQGFPANHFGGLLWSCNFAIRRELFHRFGGFDEGFPAPAMEDVEFHTRLRKEEIHPTFVPQAVVRHPWQRRKGMAFCRHYAQSVSHYVKIHPEMAGRFTIVAQCRHLFRFLLRDLPCDLARYRGRGVARNFLLNVYSSYRVLRELNG